ncbi:TPA: hypothetical protein DHW62_00845 [candidate division WWE3 bacterium]|uniref:Glycosyltransferase RgtA/B/C/D-like domain-containing protein n=1 Tax=candidate division WWE3 bacterium TaxID=2053526 RepID=A0A656PN68_UNCKA|nr:glycosyl transferase family protein [candidate division WWE3 bacterium RAAC2_WWE3_1]KKS30153.1 MAG: Glycosyl transferase family 39 [candidate division WWE3 bacterium GW2011_GWB1_42_117]KKS55202.1 MAG: Glycosyl transferase family 39 [candidate division WWE3 bacterium GW2011_GWD2_42_34]KKT05753.1 MAG: Glycosyl transferase family 39 [candidate division WWE3 bacterium GW2011_GWE2_43_18]KKT07357.1 MAG: Glycosyl transferase family 39 [candidate division WWE3 bacterium GW2011_GWF2_43_18]KKT08997.1
MSKKTSSLLYLIIFLALVLRLAGISHGFPFIFHPDEPTIVQSALGVRFDPNPGHFDWPHFFIYANYFVFNIFAKIRDLAVDYNIQNFMIKIFPLMWDDTVVFYFITRVFVAVLGGLTVIPVYKTGKVLFGEKVGLLSALAFAVIPFHVRHSHYSLPDTPMLFFLSWGIYFAARILSQGYPIDYVFSGLFIGIAASTKYNGGLGALTVPLAAFLRRVLVKMRLSENLSETRGDFPYFKTVLNLILSGIFAFLGFVLGTPYSVLDYKTFSRTDSPLGAFWQFTNVGSVDFAEHVSKFFTDISFKISDDMGYTILVSLFLTLGVVLIRFLKGTFSRFDVSLMFLIVSALVFIYYISGFEKSRSQYYFIIYPFVSVVFGYFCVWVVNKISLGMKPLYFPVILLLFLAPFYLSVDTAVRFLRNDTRLDLKKFLETEVPFGTRVVYGSSDAAAVSKYVFNNAVKDPGKLPKGTRYYYIELNKGVSSGRAIFEVSNKGRIGPYITVEEMIR